MIFLCFFYVFFIVFFIWSLYYSDMRYYVLSVTKENCRVLYSSDNFRKSVRFLNTKLMYPEESLELVSDSLVKYLLDDVKINFDWSDCKTD